MELGLINSGAAPLYLGVAAAGSTDFNSTAVCCDNYDFVTWLVSMGVITSGAATSLKLQGSDTNNGSDWVDLLGTAVTILDTDDSKVICVDLIRPVHRYNRLVVKRATQNAVVNAVIGLLCNGRTKPALDGGTTIAAGHKYYVSPIAGTP